VKKLYTVAEAAEVLNVKVSTIRAWIANRKLPRVNCGRSVRVPAQAIVDFVERNTIPALQEKRAADVGGVTRLACVRRSTYSGKRFKKGERHGN
jgi:excisionase family DNA binding protein